MKALEEKFKWLTLKDIKKSQVNVVEKKPMKQVDSSFESSVTDA
jgi:hypothetical protein